ncbi:DUF3055 domain-containing protein [Salipaludibacillus sp. LMS25]|uniref:DUF3055 domain-containing protein n=1 Tax=Salipaludibacillus sp. LMS25 TaxID=2924031 RepID=UPI0020D06FFE|nr:DUF3055 domain-containing protein [Salipaludibacillus sp. LMS25]UTR15848.1 DUF3055 domain-containing protein [Salipaludibacillus sp. LMS25]
MTDRFFLYDDSEDTTTRFVSFMGENQRFDLAIITTTRYYGKKLVLNMLSSRYAIIGTDDLEEDNYLETVFELSEEDGQELREFLYNVI